MSSYHTVLLATDKCPQSVKRNQLPMLILVLVYIIIQIEAPVPIPWACNPTVQTFDPVNETFYVPFSALSPMQYKDSQSCIWKTNVADGYYYVLDFTLILQQNDYFNLSFTSGNDETWTGLRYAGQTITKRRYYPIGQVTITLNANTGSTGALTFSVTAQKKPIYSETISVTTMNFDESYVLRYSTLKDAQYYFMAVNPHSYALAVSSDSPSLSSCFIYISYSTLKVIRFAEVNSYTGFPFLPGGNLTIFCLDPDLIDADSQEAVLIAQFSKTPYAFYARISGSHPINIISGGSLDIVITTICYSECKEYLDAVEIDNLSGASAGIAVYGSNNMSSRALIADYLLLNLRPNFLPWMFQSTLRTYVLNGTFNSATLLFDNDPTMFETIFNNRKGFITSRNFGLNDSQSTSLLLKVPDGYGPVVLSIDFFDISSNDDCVISIQSDLQDMSEIQDQHSIISGSNFSIQIEQTVVPSTGMKFNFAVYISGARMHFSLLFIIILLIAKC